MKHPRGSHRSHISGSRWVKSAAKRGIIDKLRDRAEYLNKHLKK